MEAEMKIGKMFVMLLLAGITISFAIPAWSALNTSVTEGNAAIKVNPNAPGTKLSGPLTVYYVQTGWTTPPPGVPAKPVVDMYIFMRVRQGNNLYPFSAVIRGAIYEAADLQYQIEDFNAFIANTVIPVLYQGVSPAPEFLVKVIDQDVQDNNTDFPGCCKDDNGDNMWFAIMDITIAVQD